MTKKKASKVSSKKASPIVKERTGIDPYKKLLARVAGNVAAGILTNPFPGETLADMNLRLDALATAAVVVAEGILSKVGVEPTSDSPT
jgi:hypothetical protein